MDEYELCADINGECSCHQVGARPCSTITEMLENGQTAEDELERIQAAVLGAADEEL